MDEHPDYYEIGPHDDIDEIEEDEQCPCCGAEIMVEGTTLGCAENCGWFEEHEDVGQPAGQIERKLQ